MQFGVIFDVDGVLVDSYSPHKKSWDIVAEKDEIRITDQQFLGTYGRAAREIVEVFWGKDISPDKIRQIDEEKENVYRRLIEHEFPAMPGAAVLVRTLFESGLKIAIGSSGPKENVETAVAGLGIRPYLDAVVTGNDVVKAKPNPEIFLLDAQKLGLPPQQCVVIEDSPFGIAAARAAGMKCIGFLSTGHHLGEYEFADKIVHSLSEISPDTIVRLLQ